MLHKSFWGWEAKKAEWGQVLMLSWSPARIAGGPASPVAKVFTAVVVCIHPCQVVMSIKDTANDLLSHSITTLDEEHERPLSTTQALGGYLLPKSIESFIPSPALPRRPWWSEGGMAGPLSGAQQTYGGEAPPSAPDLGGMRQFCPLYTRKTQAFLGHWKWGTWVSCGKIHSSPLPFLPGVLVYEAYDRPSAR